MLLSFSQQARWLVPPSGERRRRAGSNEWYAWRNVLQIGAGAVGRVVFRIAADTKYDLFVNGRLVMREGGLKRGPTPDGTYCDAVEIGEWLEPGDNCLAVLLWYFGRDGFSHRDSGQPGLLADADTGTLGRWRVRAHPAYFDAGYLHDAFRLSENSVGYDAHREMEGWTEAGFDDSAWPEPETAGTPGTPPWGAIEPRPFPQWFWSEPRDYVSVDRRPGISGDGFAYYHCRLPHNAQFVPHLEVEAPAGIQIEVASGQATAPIGAAYITRAGWQSHTLMGWMNGEEVIYKIPSDTVRVVALRYLETGYPAEFAGKFSCGDQILDRLWQKARRTLYVTMHDTFMDCPCRERAQWPGDFVVQLGQVPYCLGATGQRLVRKALREIFRWQRPDGTLYGPVPEGNWDVELPAQMLAVLSPFGLLRYYEDTGDIDLLREVYPMAKRYLDVWRWQEDGRIVYRPERRGAVADCMEGKYSGLWDWIDWGDRIDAEPALNAWMLLALEGLAGVARAIGEEADARAFADRKQAMIRAVRAAYRNAERGAFVSPGFADEPDEPDDRVQALMVLGGAVEPGEYPQITRWIRRVEQASPYMEYYVLSALFAMEEPDAALERMRRRYSTLAKHATSTLWENWPEIGGDHGSKNHSWSGGPLTLLSREAAGLAAAEPGWTRIRFRPQPGPLTRFAVSVKTPHGEIEASGRRDADGWEIFLNGSPSIGVDVDFSALGGHLIADQQACGSGKCRWRLTVDPERITSSSQ
jgi:hypothetical protein